MDEARISARLAHPNTVQVFEVTETDGLPTMVLDFGIAKSIGSEVETRVGVLKGKLRYMAPEQVVPGRHDRRIDVFAVGVMMWEALARRRY